MALKINYHGFYLLAIAIHVIKICLLCEAQFFYRIDGENCLAGPPAYETRSIVVFLSISRHYSGAGGENRTHDTMIFSHLLYH